MKEILFVIVMLFLLYWAVKILMVLFVPIAIFLVIFVVLGYLFKD